MVAMVATRYASAGSGAVAHEGDRFSPSAGWIANVARYNPVNWAVVASHEALLASPPEWGNVLIRIGSLTLFNIAAVLLGTTSFRSYQRST
jgi:ABC-2 type transport system permease protein